MLILGVAIAAVGLIAGTWVRRRRHRDEETAHPGGEAAAAAGGARVKAKTAAVLLVPILYVYLIHQLGFYLVTPFFLAGFMHLLGVRGWRRVVTITLVLYAAIVGVFINLLFTPLPQGAGIFHTINGKLIGFLQ